MNRALIQTMQAHSELLSVEQKILYATAHARLQIQHLMMHMAIQHCHAYKMWKSVHNFLLEKNPGIPLITNLRVIHIYETDWSLIQKFFVTHKFNTMASKNWNIPVEQAGASPGRSSIERGMGRLITYETIRYQRLHGGVSTMTPKHDLIALSKTLVIWHSSTKDFYSKSHPFMRKPSARSDTAKNMN
jgi:hypothetical protein